MFMEYLRNMSANMITPLRGGMKIGSDFARIFASKMKTFQFVFSQAFALKLPLTQKFQVKNCVVYIFTQLSFPTSRNGATNISKVKKLNLTAKTLYRRWYRSYVS